MLDPEMGRYGVSSWWWGLLLGHLVGLPGYLGGLWGAHGCPRAGGWLVDSYGSYMGSIWVYMGPL